MSEVILPSTLYKLKASAEVLRELRHGAYDSAATSFVNPFKIPVSLAIKPSTETFVLDNCDGHVFEFTATHPDDPTSSCVITIGFDKEEEDLQLHCTYKEFPVDSSVVVNAIEDGVRAYASFFG